MDVREEEEVYEEEVYEEEVYKEEVYDAEEVYDVYVDAGFRQIRRLAARIGDDVGLMWEFAPVI